MKKLNWVYSIAIALIFVVATFTAMFSTGSTINTVLRDYVFNTEECSYVRAPEPVEKEEIVAPECKTDSNRTKRDLASSLSLLIVSAPIAGMTFKSVRKSLKN